MLYGLFTFTQLYGLYPIFNDRKRLLPSIAYLEGEYGCSDICFGVPTIIGYQGIEKIIEVDMNNDEYQQLQHS
ncbi:hypothetical protein ACV34L_32980, partial [Pseudomonas aeruginosa]